MKRNQNLYELYQLKAGYARFIKKNGDNIYSFLKHKLILLV